MKHVKLLDCTLRDGAYLVDKKFGRQAIEGMVEGLVRAGIDFIEIGFFQDEGFGEGRTVYQNSADAKRFIPNDKCGCEFTVLADYSRYSISNLDEHTDDSVDAVRECFFKHERHDALEVCREIKDKGYKLFVQPVDILGYSDRELAEFLEMVNETEPYCLSIVDTFGSMYQEDLHRVFEIINHNLEVSCRVGFHSHNNMQLSNALSQEFARMAAGKREIVIDGTISGMGRGAGNTPTELIAQYLVSMQGKKYDIDVLLDLIDTYMDNIRTRCSWGYTTGYFIAGCYGAHVNNISYLKSKNSLRSKDIRYILNRIGSEERKRYDYDLLEHVYLELLDSDIDDSDDMDQIKKQIGKNNVLIIVPGSSAATEEKLIKDYIAENKPIVISVNFLHDSIQSDFVYMNNTKRYRYWRSSPLFKNVRKILTSNIADSGNSGSDSNAYVISFMKLIKCGWEHMDNSTIMLLRLLDLLEIRNIAIAGFDGYSYINGETNNYAAMYMELSNDAVNPALSNREIAEMLTDFWEEKRTCDMSLQFITKSRFEMCIKHAD